ncbi:MAG: zinc-ribbon domain-containing protein [Geobacteraceae bacterium]|nr:zinc-ribbon domain-containing protein [Geobacteraceae bacterium]
MFISCPLCRTRFRFDEQKVRSGSIKLRCSKCSAIFRLSAEKGERGGRLAVLLAHESVEFCAAVEKVLAAEPFDLISCHDGKEALDLVSTLKPDVVLLNVALPTMYGFQVCEALRANPDTIDTKIILLAAIYDKTKYKRSPQSLYGADDYIEQHHIPDALAAMIYRLAANTVEIAADSPPEATVETSPDRLTASEAEKQEIARKELMNRPQAENQDAREVLYRAARQLARSIVSDISLYRESELEEAAKNGDIEHYLGLEIRDGRAIYESRMPEFLSFPVDFYAEAVAELISQKKKEMGINEG